MTPINSKIGVILATTKSISRNSVLQSEWQKIATLMI